MKYLFLETVFDSPHLETSAEIALNLKLKKNDVFFSWLGDNLPWSDWHLSRTKRVFGASIQKKVNLIQKILEENNINLIKPNKIEKQSFLKISYLSKFEPLSCLIILIFFNLAAKIIGKEVANRLLKVTM